jgi:hypothetical protein
MTLPVDLPFDLPVPVLIAIAVAVLNLLLVLVLLWRLTVQRRGPAVITGAASWGHRPVWRFSSEENTGGQRVRFYVCTVAGCRDILRVNDEKEPSGVA